MTHSIVRRTLAAALLAGVGAMGFAAAPAVHAQSVGPSTPPTTFDSSHPTVSGILVAKPGEPGSDTHTACDSQNSPDAMTKTVRGIVICSDAGKYVLLQVNKNTEYFARYWGEYRLRDFRDGDRVNAWGILRDGGILLRPTYAVQDVDLQEAFTDSTDFIMGRNGGVLQLGVLSSTQGGPVQGVVYAVHQGPVHVTLCNGKAGTWASLKPGEKITITDSLFNRRLNLYIDTNTVQVSC